MLLLALDTSTSAITVAVHDGARQLAACAALDARAHTERLGPLVRDCLHEAGAAPADLTDIAVGTGPGPFTGLRVGVVTALTFGHARGIPVHGVCSLDALAGQAADRRPDGEFLVATDARRKEVYWARFEARGGDVRRLTDPAVGRPAELPDEVRALPTAGRGPVLFPDLFPSPVDILDVDAGALARLAVRRLAAGEPMPAEPLYLRRPDAMPTPSRKPALPKGRA